MVHQVVDHLTQAVCLELYLEQEVLSSLRIPFDVGPAQTTHEALDVAQRQP
jgi:hypothetical protein